MDYSEVFEESEMSDDSDLFVLSPQIASNQMLKVLGPDEIYDDSTYPPFSNLPLDNVFIKNKDIDQSAKEKTAVKTSEINHCPYCTDYFLTTASLHNHVSSVHKVKFLELIKHNEQFRCAASSDCEAVFSRVNAYRQHLTVIHGIKIKKVTSTFKKYKEFWTWKLKEQNNTSCCFNKFFCKRVLGENKSPVIKKCFICCKSDENTKKNDPNNCKRLRKEDFCCSAMMEVLCYPQKFVLTYYKTHVGHEESNEVSEAGMKSEKQPASKSQKNMYEQVKLEVKDRVDDFLVNVFEDKLSYDFLRMLSKNLDRIFEPDSWKDGVFVQSSFEPPDSDDSEDESETSPEDEDVSSDSDVQSMNAESGDESTDRNENNTWATTSDVSNKQDSVPASPDGKQVSKGPIVIYASKEIVPQSEQLTTETAKFCEEPKSKPTFVFKKVKDPKLLVEMAPSPMVVVNKGSLPGTLYPGKDLQSSVAKALLDKKENIVVDENAIVRLFQNAQQCKPDGPLLLIPVKNTVPSFDGKPSILPNFQKPLDLKPNQEVFTLHSECPEKFPLNNCLSEIRYRVGAGQFDLSIGSNSVQNEQVNIGADKVNHAKMSFECLKNAKLDTKLIIPSTVLRQASVLSNSRESPHILTTPMDVSKPAAKDNPVSLLKSSNIIFKHLDSLPLTVPAGQSTKLILATNDKNISLLQSPSIVVKTLSAIKKSDGIIHVKHNYGVDLDGVNSPSKPVADSLSKKLETPDKQLSESEKKAYIEKLWNLYKNK